MMKKKVLLILFVLLVSNPLFFNCKNTVNNADTDIVYITKTGDKFHRSSCHYLSKSKISISRDDAISAGYTACSVCKP
jgi:predicted small secreted protein